MRQITKSIGKFKLGRIKCKNALPLVLEFIFFNPKIQYTASKTCFVIIQEPITQDPCLRKRQPVNRFFQHGQSIFVSLFRRCHRNHPNHLPVDFFKRHECHIY